MGLKSKLSLSLTDTSLSRASSLWSLTMGGLDVDASPILPLPDGKASNTCAPDLESESTEEAMPDRTTEFKAAPDRYEDTEIGASAVSELSPSHRTCKFDAEDKVNTLPDSRPQESFCDIKYGYVEIPDYRNKRSRSAIRRFEDLPAGAVVESYPHTARGKVWSEQKPCSDHNNSRGVLRKQASLRNCGSTVAHKTRFRDEVVPGDKIEDRHYIDRDICGVSLFRYTPDAPLHIRLFTSSPYGRDFLQDLDEIHQCSKKEQLEREAHQAAVQPDATGWHCGCCGMSWHPGSAQAEEGICCGQGLNKGLLQDFNLGIYRVVKNATVGSNAYMQESQACGIIHRGVLVRVVEIVLDTEADRIRGRVEAPSPGWISLQNTSNKVPWVIPQKEELVEEEMELDAALRRAGVDDYYFRLDD